MSTRTKANSESGLRLVTEPATLWHCLKCDALNRGGGEECFDCGADAQLGRVIMRADLDERIARYERARKNAVVSTALEIERLEGLVASKESEVVSLRREVAQLAKDLDVARQLYADPAKFLQPRLREPEPSSKLSPSEASFDVLEPPTRWEMAARMRDAGMQYAEIGKRLGWKDDPGRAITRARAAQLVDKGYRARKGEARRAAEPSIEETFEAMTKHQLRQFYATVEVFRSAPIPPAPIPPSKLARLFPHYANA